MPGCEDMNRVSHERAEAACQSQKVPLAFETEQSKAGSTVVRGAARKQGVPKTRPKAEGSRGARKSSTAASPIQKSICGFFLTQQ
jgi:hypothetical protein